jgi:hypothetical protein
VAIDRDECMHSRARISRGFPMDRRRYGLDRRPAAFLFLLCERGIYSVVMVSYNITRVLPTRSWMASAATSSRRLEISYGKYECIPISPMDEETFLKELAMRCPSVRIEERATAER